MLAALGVALGALALACVVVARSGYLAAEGRPPPLLDSARIVGGYAWPYVAALLALGVAWRAHRGPVWLASGLLACLGALSAFSGLTLVLLPSGLLLAAAGAWAVRTPAGRPTPAGAAVFGVVVAVGAALWAALVLRR